jgi:DNA polymerase-3 subunit delta
MRYQNVKAFQKHLGSAAPHHLCRVYLIAVPDDFERRCLLDELVSLLLVPDQPLLRLSAVDSTLSEIFTAIDSPSLFAPEPIALVDEMEKLSKKNGQGFLDLLARPQLTGYLILGSRGKTVLYQAVEKCGAILDLCEEKPWEKEKRLAEQLFERARQAGKRLAPNVPQLLFDRVDKDSALLAQEIDKLICFTGDRSTIEQADVLQISAASRTHTLWQTAEEIVWEGGDLQVIDSSSLYGLLPAFRSQFQLGLKISSLLESQIPISEMSARLPKIWPKVLDKRTSQAARLGSSYFRKGLDLLFRIESLSRLGATDISVLLDFFRVSIHVRR